MENKFQTLTRHNLKFCPFLIAIIISIFLGSYILCFSFIFHEWGHILFGSIGNLIIEKTLPMFKITSVVTCPIFPYFELPQQVTMIEGSGTISALYIFGGIISVILFSIIASLLFYYKFRVKEYFLFPIILSFHEMFGNYLCGTDNLLGTASSFCSNGLITDFFLQTIPYFLMFSVFLIIYPYLDTKFPTFFNWLTKKIGKKG